MGKLNQKKSKMENQKKSMILGSAIMICEKYHPLLAEKNGSYIKRQIVVATLKDNPKYCKDLVSYYNGNIKNDLTISHFRASLNHDIAGLRNKDPHFLPRIS